MAAGGRLLVSPPVGRLDALDLSLRLDRSEYEQRLGKAQKRLLEQRLRLGGLVGEQGLGPGLLVVFEGSDAGGKGGAIKRVVEHLDPRHYRVTAYAKPTPDEKRHHFLWRFYREIPGLGGMCVFDRSWYGRVLVERVEGFATDEQWGRAYDEILQFERTLVLEGVIVVKFWLQISADEQLRRFEERQRDPLRAWKLTDEDWRNRDKAEQYAQATEDMLELTEHELAPWDLIEAEQKRFARVKVLETLIRRIDEGVDRWEQVAAGR